jgi:DNA-binding NarL/FixJ family response regulator
MLTSPHPQPLSKIQRAANRRQQVLPLVLAGQSHQQIMTALSLNYRTVEKSMQQLYREHGVNGSGPQCRRRLLEKLGATPQNQPQSPA